MKTEKKSLYNKYRPKTFDEVIGQSIAKIILINSIKMNKINHAYLFYGIRGIGKTTLARIFSRAINCENSNNYNPCNKCSICVSIENGTLFDVLEIDAASNNGVDEIREIKDNTNYLTTRAKYKVFIIDEVHMLSKAAFNALLKMLEEPPKNTIFLLATTEMNKIPQTVLSRVVILNLESLSNNDIYDGLRGILANEKISYNDEALEYIIKVSGGSLRDAISNLEAILLYNNHLSVENVISALKLIKKDDIVWMLNNDIFALINEIEKPDKDPNKILLIIFDELIDMIKKGRNDYINILNLLLSHLNTIKDPSLLKVAIKTSLLTLYNDQLINKNITRDNKEIRKQKEKNEKVEKIEQLNKFDVDNITKYVDINNIIYILKNKDDEELRKTKSRWTYKDNYILNPKYENVVSTLLKTQPVIATKKMIIVLFNDETLIPRFKNISLSSYFFEFIKEFLGEYKFIFPINKKNWDLISKKGEKVEIDIKKHQDIKIKIEDFLEENINKQKNSIDSIFGEENTKHYDE